MMKAIGMIETIGLVTATVAADAAVKSANVALIGYENSKGGGLITVKVEGDVGAVNAAISAARSAAQQVGGVHSTLIIPRPAAHLEALVYSPDTIGLQAAEIQVVAPEPVDHVEEPAAAQANDTVAETPNEATIIAPLADAAVPNEHPAKAPNRKKRK